MIGRIRDVLGAHPRHVVLAGLVCGLLTATVGPGLPFVLAVVLAALVPRPAWLVPAVAVAGLAGAFIAHERVGALDDRMPHLPVSGEHFTADVVLASPVRTGSRGARTATVLVRGKGVLLRLRHGQRDAPGVGEILRVTGTLRPPDRHARLLRLAATLHADGSTRTGRRRGGARGGVDRLRDRAQAALTGRLRPSSAALLRGMVLGDDSAIPVPLRDAMRDAGLSHLVAASGQNVLLLSTLVLLLGAALAMPRAWRLGAAIAVVVMYVPLAGAGPSIQRAAVMGIAGLVAALAGRPASRWYSVLVAAVVTLAVEPHAARDLGWQLSFAAILGLLVIGSRVRDRLVARGMPSGLADAVATTLAATLATAPLLAFTFGEASLVSVPANILAAPLVGPVMWLGFVAAALGQVSTGTGGFVADLAALPLAGIVLIGEQAARIPGATVRPAPGLVLAAVALVAGAVLDRRVRALSPGLALALLALGPAVTPRPLAVLAPPSGARVSFLDIGQGDATVLQHGRHSVLVDTGPPGGPVVERLRRVGVRRLDLLVVTHAQDDHDGGAAAVLQSLQVESVLDGRDGRSTPDGDRMAHAARARNIRLLTPDAGQVLRVGGIVIRVRSPRREPRSLHAGEDPNDRSIVIEATVGPLRVLLPADAESGVLAGLDLAETDVMKVSHHGSDDPGLPSVLQRIQPQIAVISVGKRNPFGHPTAATLSALRTHVPTVLRTDADGTVVLDVDRHGTRRRILR